MCCVWSSRSSVKEPKTCRDHLRELPPHAPAVALGAFPTGKERCPEMAEQALQAAARQAVRSTPSTGYLHPAADRCE